MTRTGERWAREIVRERSNGVCEIAVPGVCQGRAVNFSHRIGQGQGGLWTPSNGLDACGSGTTGCHGWATHNRTQARDRGWILFRCDDPLTTPAQHAMWGRVLLDDAGCFTFAP